MCVNRVRLYVFLAFLGVLVTGCVKVEIKDERPYPTYFEIALVTHTPQQPTGVEAATLPPTSTQPLPTSTFTPVPSQTPTNTALPTQTNTPAPLTGSLSQNAYCRQGPATIFPARILLTAGEQVTILGRNPEGTWWLVQAAGSSQSCWTSGLSLNLAGEAGGVSIATAPAVPVQVQPAQASATPTRRPRQKQPTSTPGGGPAPTDTPIPYPYP